MNKFYSIKREIRKIKGKSVGENIEVAAVLVLVAVPEYSMFYLSA